MADAEYKRFRCGHCAVEFEAIKEKRYCTKKCNRAAIKKNKSSVSRAEYLAKVRENAVGNFTCEHCGKASFRKLSGTSHSSNRFCSMACRRAASADRVKRIAEHRIEMRACEVCGTAFETSRHRKARTDACREEKARRSRKEANRRKRGKKKE